MADSDIRVNIIATDQGLQTTMKEAVEAIGKLPTAAQSADAATQGLSTGFMAVAEAARAGIADTNSLAQYYRNVGAAAKEASEPASDFSAVVQRIGEIAAGVFGSRMIENALHGIAEEFRSIVSAPFEWAESINRTAAMIGTSVEKTQELAFAARATGTEFGRVSMLAGQLAREIAALQGGTGGSKAGVLAAAGLSIDDLRDVPTFINAAADAMTRFGDDSQQVRTLLADLGGRMGLQFLPMIEHWKELSATAREFGLILDDQTVKAMAGVQEKFNILGAIIDVDKERLASALMPTIETFIQLLTEAAEEINIMSQTGQLQVWAASFSDLLITVAESAIALTKEVDHLAGGVESLALRARSAVEYAQGYFASAAADWKAAGDASGTLMMDAFAKSATAHLEELRGQIKASFSGIGQMDVVGGPDKKKTPLPDFTGGTAGAKAAEQAQAEHEQMLADTFKSFQQEQLLEVAQAGGIAAAKIAADQRVVAEAKTLFGEHSSQYIESLTKELDESNRTADSLMRDNERVARSYAKTFADQDRAAHKFFEDEIKESDKAAKETAKTWQGVMGQIAASFDQVIDSILKGTDSIAGAFKKMGEQIALDMIHSGITGLLGGGAPGSATASIFGGGGSGFNLSSLLSGLFGGAGGGSGGAGGLGGVFASAFSSGPAQAATASTFGAAFNSSGGILSSLFGSIFSMLGPMLGIGGAGAAGAGLSSAGLEGMMALLPMLALEHGGVIPSAAGGMQVGNRGTFAILHPRELVLPSGIASRFTGGAGDTGENAGGRVEHHTHVHIHATDAKSFRDRLSEHADAIAQKLMRNMVR